MEVILLEKIEKVGGIGDRVKVALSPVSSHETG